MERKVLAAENLFQCLSKECRSLCCSHALTLDLTLSLCVVLRIRQNRRFEIQFECQEHPLRLRRSCRNLMGYFFFCCLYFIKSIWICKKKKSKKDDLNRKSTKAFVEKHVVLFRAGKCLKWYIILLSVIFGIFIFSAFHYTLNYTCYSLIYNINIIGTFLPLRLAKDTVVVSSVNQKKRLILLNLFKEPLKWNSLVTRSDVFWLKIQIWENLAMNLCAFWLCSYSISVY